MKVAQNLGRCLRTLNYNEYICQDLCLHLSWLVSAEMEFNRFPIYISWNGHTYSPSKSLSNPTNDLGVLKANVKELFERLLNEVPELEVRRAGVRVASLSQTLKKQKQLTEFA